MCFTSARPEKTCPSGFRSPAPVISTFVAPKSMSTRSILAVWVAASTVARALTDFTRCAAGRMPGSVTTPLPPATSTSMLRTSPWPSASICTRPASTMSTPRSSAMSGDRSASIDGLKPSTVADSETRLRSRV